MVSYDSDSSGENADDYTTTNVLLGYASKEPTEDPISQLGGRPVWPSPPNTPTASLAKCKVCKNIMTLLLQLHSDLPEFFPSHERRLYVFSCRRKTCRRSEGSIRVIRSVRVSRTSTPAVESETPHNMLSSQKPPTTQINDIGRSLFGAGPGQRTDSANPFSTSSGINRNPFSFKTSASEIPIIKPAQTPIYNDLQTTFAQKARLSSPSSSMKTLMPVEPWPSEAELPPAYPVYYLDADYETLDAPKESASASQSIEVDETELMFSQSTGTQEDSEVFESTIDKTFQSFADRLAQNSQQVLRYEFRGSPLLYSKVDAVGLRLAPFLSSSQASNSRASAASKISNSGLPECANCGSSRVFELQLTPQAIYELEVDEMGLDGMEWGTIIVGVCGKDCQAKGVAVGQVGYLEEWMGVQWEERGAARR